MQTDNQMNREGTDVHLVAQGKVLGKLDDAWVAQAMILAYFSEQNVISQAVSLPVMCFVYGDAQVRPGNTAQGGRSEGTRGSQSSSVDVCLCLVFFFRKCFFSRTCNKIRVLSHSSALSF
jgi:hypothetical protein